ncbi:Delta(12) fatty acid desaturase [Bifiguratus adelaidae]|uniref:Delta(12) fatty acid desaturase n=1 Tax=Bifiguratus adelaidae TaxID=1938954 RepID=A0A261Y184_9FUNG|nr:Delta(12) fatty acid desaturase [Bifiguratus adelaidae]
MHRAKSDPRSHSDEAEPVLIERDWELPTFTIKEIRDAIPAHCFKRDTLRSFSYVVHDLAIVAALGYAATFIDQTPAQAQSILWPMYWIAQGIVATGIWVLAHECGHQAFSDSKFINNTVGYILHSALLVPYHSWRITHSKHHKATGHLKKDQVFVPHRRSEFPARAGRMESEDEEHHSLLDEAPLYTLYNMVLIFLFGWPLYLLFNTSGQDYGRWTSHFLPTAPIFEKHQFWDVVMSDIGVIGMIGGLVFAGQVFSTAAVVKYYLIPYLFVNFWLVLITYLQHTDPKLPHYSDRVWNFQRGAALTIDRSFGSIINHFHHHISDTHVAHHFFSTMPHYHAEEATRHIQKALGKSYYRDNTPIPLALWRSFTECKFVEDEGDVVFYKH